MAKNYNEQISLERVLNFTIVLFFKWPNFLFGGSIFGQTYAANETFTFQTVLLLGVGIPDIFYVFSPKLKPNPI